jgi:hypothetical protein
MKKIQKCNINFTSQYVHIKTNGETLCLNINEYIEQFENYKNCVLYCNNNHELCFANGKKVKPYFRHKNSEDTGGYPMSTWHCEWQSNFPITEVVFNKINDKQIKERRADVFLNDNFVIEFQHSKINAEDVNNRMYDYKFHNKEIIWVVDGNGSILVKELNYSKRIYLEFTSDYWKFESFINCPYVYIDINSYIYKIIPKNIKSYMIDVQLPVTKDIFINNMLNNIIIFNDDEPNQSNLFIKQQGAGNGKTFGIIQMLQSNDFKHYKYFIYVTKQHSARFVIFSELKKQIENGNLKNLRLVSDLEECEKNSVSTKKYIVKFLNLTTNNYCEIIIGTIDSFMYCISNKKISDIDKFQGIVNSIIDNHIETKTKNGTISYGGMNIILNKETILIGDEFQDPTNNYAKAIIQIMRDRYIDAYVVGDKLQSISIENNAFTYLLDNHFSHTNKTIFDFTNICRRFNNKTLIEFVNYVIPFDKFNLPTIKLCENLPDNKDSLVIFEGEEFNNYKENECKINDEVDKIMKHYINEVILNNREPNDFLIVTPFTHKNPLVDALELAINIYWSNIKKDNNFTRYAIFHKSEQGTSIDLSESENSTRIVSIHSSKGDGRNVVFVIGLDEQSLKKFSGESENLIYYSLLHVAVTRMIQKLYIYFVNNSDHIARKIKNYLYEKNITNIKPNFKIYNSVNYKDLSEELKKDFKIIKENIIDNAKLENLYEENENKQIIDMSHHNIRYSGALINTLMQIITDENKNKNKDVKKQIKAILYNITQIGITVTDTWKGYNILLKDRSIPILKITDKGLEYIKYFEIIVNIANNILTKIKKIINSQNNEILCPIECVVLYYMIETSKQGNYTDITILEIYNIIDIYNKSFDSNLKNHETCICKKCFYENIFENKTSKILSMQQYISSHYENINNVSSCFKEFCKKFPNVNWLYKHPVNFYGKNVDYKIYKYFELIGYDENNVIICYIKPQFNDLNYNDTLLKSISDVFLLKNIKKNNQQNDETNDQPNDDNFLKFYNKRITTVIFTTDKDKPYYIVWTNEDNEDLIYKNIVFIKNIFENKLFEKYKTECKSIYYFYKYWRENIPNQISSPLKVIEFIIDKYNEIKTNNSIKSKEFPYFISDFFNNIKFLIEYCKDKEERKKILQKYDEDNFFIENLENKIKYSINRFLKDDENSDEE